ncbi:hypothetical protein Tco_0681474 [Tanacetum coccineum]|uniref:Xylulose kinase-1 n=1 Tax=Tanacetum coccineum TaxID=301880 RepID=A0ABQ4XQ45_9ASTR
MEALKFVDSYNMVAYLERPTDNDDFTEIVDFLNANPIRYALTVNPTIYVSCIEQFWSTAKAQTINEETQIHALVDGKKIVITESSVRRDLQFADEDGTDCLPTTTIFENLKLMGPKKNAWNEFSSNIASAIICLATNQKFNCSKMVFDGMTRNLDSLSAKFLMYPRLLQVFLDKQLDKVPSHNAVYNAHCHTKKVFANMKRIGKVTPLFDTILIQHQSEVGEGSGHPTDPQHTPTIDQSPISEPIVAQSSHQPIKTYKPRKPKKKVTQIPQSSEPINLVADEAVLKERGDSLERAATTASSLKAERVSVQDLETTKATQAKEITSLKKRVKKLEQRGSLGDQEDASKQRRHIAEIDADVDISLVHKDAGIHGRSRSNVAKKEVSAVDPITTAGEVVTTASIDISTASVRITVSTAIPTTPPTTTTKDDMTLAETLMEIKSAKPKALGVVMQEPSEIPRISAAQQQIQEKAPGSRDKAQLQAEIEEDDRLARQKEEDNNVSWDNAQAMMEADYQMAERLQAEEQDSLTNEEKARLFVQLLDARKKHFAALRA